MNHLSLIGSFIVTLSLVSYSIGIISEQKSSKIKRRVLRFVTLGVLLDISATTFMILGSRNSPFTFHGFLGYSALLVMISETVSLWSSVHRLGMGGDTPRWLHRYSLFAYIWWIIAYISGILIAKF
jgi:uncharacterized repeat protein (TIGR03987 family)